mmetsp:Transcript_89827/g.187783  ORF Transcript_89827/g.187783 Transcript_89827/m.187783 type:complete len:249 (+) Transcript_89827:2212-2958(+)
MLTAYDVHLSAEVVARIHMGLWCKSLNNSGRGGFKITCVHVGVCHVIFDSGRVNILQIHLLLCHGSSNLDQVGNFVARDGRLPSLAGRGPCLVVRAGICCIPHQRRLTRLAERGRSRFDSVDSRHIAARFDATSRKKRTGCSTSHPVRGGATHGGATIRRVSRSGTAATVATVLPPRLILQFVLGLVLLLLLLQLLLLMALLLVLSTLGGDVSLAGGRAARLDIARVHGCRVKEFQRQAKRREGRKRV